MPCPEMLLTHKQNCIASLSLGPKYIRMYISINARLQFSGSGTCRLCTRP